jgi:hypothetical protein
VPGLSCLLALACGWLARPGVRAPALPGGAALALGALFAVPALIEALAPPTDTDEIYQHLALARLISDTGGLVGGLDHPDGSRPILVQLVFAGLYGVGGETAPRFWHLLVTGALVLAARELGEARFGAGRGDLAAAALLGTGTLLHEAGLAYNDLPAALAVLVAAEAALRGSDRAAGLLAGVALAAKYTAAPAVAGVAVLIALRRRAIPWGMAWALVPLAPWPLRNTMAGLHPLFPYAGWPTAEGFAFVYPEKYGLGRELPDWILLPWNLLVRAESDSFVFLGRLNLAWAGLLAGAAWAGRREPVARALVVAVGVGGMGWALGAQLVRYLLPLAGLAALAAAAGPPVRAWWLLWAASLPANLGFVLASAAARLDVARGAESREAFLERELGAWGAVSWLRDHADGPVALLYAWQGYYVDQAWILGSVEDHVPTRWWLATRGDAALRDLAGRGVRWLLVGDHRFLRKSYPFLTASQFDARFTAPDERLRTLLLRDARREFAGRHWEVWRIEGGD